MNSQQEGGGFDQSHSGGASSRRLPGRNAARLDHSHRAALIPPGAGAAVDALSSLRDFIQNGRGAVDAFEVPAGFIQNGGDAELGRDGVDGRAGVDQNGRPSLRSCAPRTPRITRSPTRTV
ncbi:hypothetical protein ACFFMN_40305 [Planobispora siamensis]|uniref:hypothetical protein n=1 Tax=Planobispora siamensis TaxID=936338 RepID=UPI0019506F5F|nr:hypothetical protein [Planobispora siamensis]